MRLAGLAFALVLLAGCASPDLREEVHYPGCGPMPMTEVSIRAEGRELRHAVLVGGPVFRPATDCAAPGLRIDLPAQGGVAHGSVGRYGYREVRLFFEDGTLRLGVELPEAESRDLVATLASPGSPPALLDNGTPVPVTRSEWLDGPEAGGDVYHGVGNVPLRTRNETMAISVASGWNERLLVQASVTYEPYVDPATLEDAGGRVRFEVRSPDGAVVAEREAIEPQGYVYVELGPDLAPGVWSVRFEHHASARTEPTMLDSVSAWLQY